MEAMNNVTLSGTVVAAPIYIPKHIKDNKIVDARLTISLLLNDIHHTVVKLVAWGNQADGLALECFVGKHIECKAEVLSYISYVYDPDKEGAIVTYSSGVPVQTKKLVFIIKRVVLGAPGPALIGELPEYWMVDGHLHNEIWKAQIALAQMRQMDYRHEHKEWDGKATHFGHARVVIAPK